MKVKVLRKIDYGSILLPVTETDKKSLESILSSTTFKTPTLKLSVYKNRRGRYKGIILWCIGDLGVCRVQPIFATTYGYELLSLKEMEIMVEEESAF